MELLALIISRSLRKLFLTYYMMKRKVVECIDPPFKPPAKLEVSCIIKVSPSVGAYTFDFFNTILENPRYKSRVYKVDNLGEHTIAVTCDYTAYVEMLNESSKTNKLQVTLITVNMMHEGELTYKEVPVNKQRMDNENN